ncbi:hypothetical protein M7I_5722 [Glarea lozoyensis 74030]|uniref:Uncharacterized protein n=1 Tax=Glarea lozoyensis (strain ATCC 74030 / MF5533) TaxID=1104152 RepID=H0ESM4_GLAL7|nr:hypothetical protein M7I_5722 [Glarea lozoyensis 74030]
MNTRANTYETRSASERDDEFCPALRGYPKSSLIHRAQVDIKWLYCKYNFNKSTWERENKATGTADFEIPSGINDKAIYVPPETWIASNAGVANLYSTRHSNVEYVTSEELERVISGKGARCLPEMEPPKETMVHKPRRCRRGLEAQKASKAQPATTVPTLGVSCKTNRPILSAPSNNQKGSTTESGLQLGTRGNDGKLEVNSDSITYIKKDSEEPPPKKQYKEA